MPIFFHTLLNTRCSAREILNSTVTECAQMIVVHVSCFCIHQRFYSSLCIAVLDLCPVSEDCPSLNPWGNHVTSPNTEWQERKMKSSRKQNNIGAAACLGLSAILAPFNFKTITKQKLMPTTTSFQSHFIQLKTRESNLLITCWKCKGLD